MDGILLINKGKGCTSSDVVYKVKKMLKEKVGHAGTLDPEATGVLPILVGKGTQLSQFLINHDKKYIATLKLGEKTDTADGEGTIIQKMDIPSDVFRKENIEDIFNKMIGKQQQIPPMYSAVKIKGKKLYEYARAGQNVEREARNIEIYKLNLLEVSPEQATIKFEVYCSKGTYIRTLCEDIANNLGNVGYMKELNRTQVGDFCIENTVTIDEINENLQNNDFIKEHIIGIEEFFSNAEKQILEPKLMEKFLNGVDISTNITGDIVRVYDNCKKFVGIAIAKDGKLRRKIVL